MKKLMPYILMILLLLFLLWLSWLIVCLIVKAICWCFSITYTWKIGTGVWLILSLLSTALEVKNKK